MPARVARVWIDTDVALGAPSGDVDDGFAIAALLGRQRRGALEILGLSTVFGNTTAGESEECARKILQESPASFRIVRGAERPGEEAAAAEAIASLPPGTELLCLGPLTNAAAACRRDPELPGRVCLFAVGGNLSSRGFLPPLWPYEFNFAQDRASARFVLSRDWCRLTLYPLDVVRRLRVDAKRLSELARASPRGAYLASQSERWARRTRRLFRGAGFSLWDLPAALDAAGVLDGAFEMRRLSKGSERLPGTARPFRCLVSFDADRAWRAFLELLAETAPLTEPDRER